MTTAQKLLSVVAITLLLVGSALVAPPSWQESATGWVGFAASKPAKAIVVYESSTPNLLTKEQLAWLNDPKLRKDAETKGVEFHTCDPDVRDAKGQVPEELALAIAAAVKAGLPRIVLIGPRGGVTTFALPANDADARARIGL